MMAPISPGSALPAITAARVLRLVPWQRGDGLIAPDVATYVVVGDATGGPVTEIERPPEWPAAPRLKAPVALRVLHINDLHGHIARVSAFGDQPVLARVAWHLAQLRRRRNPVDPAPLLFSAGDDISGSILDALMTPADGSEGVHASYKAYSALGLSAAAVGNHDLDFGAERLAAAAATDATFPLLSANLVAAGLDAALAPAAVAPAAVFISAGVRVGVIGLTTARQHKHAGQVRLSDPLLTLGNLLPALRPLCDVVLVLSHLGLAADTPGSAGDASSDVAVAAALLPGEVHLIIGGHSHLGLNEEGLEPGHIVNGVPIVQAGANGRFLGEVTILLEPAQGRALSGEDEAATISVSVTDAHLVSISDLPVEPAYDAAVIQPLLARVMPDLQRSIGRCDNIADLGSDGLRARYDRGESALANYVTDALYERCHANGIPVDLAMIDASILRRGVPIGAPLTVGDWHQVMPYTDTVQLYSLTGGELLALLADNALRLGRPGEPRTERGFVQFSRHIRYDIELGATRWQNRVTRALIGGHELAGRPTHRLIIASHSHFRQSADAWERRAWMTDRPYLSPIWTTRPTELFLRDELLAYIEDSGGILASSGARCDGRVRVIAAHTDHEHHCLLHQPAFS
jgi:5'-nucleotidase/5'-nucleotidase/UDP-sugar diphosphatase